MPDFLQRMRQDTIRRREEKQLNDMLKDPYFATRYGHAGQYEGRAAATLRAKALSDINRHPNHEFLPPSHFKRTAKKKPFNRAAKKSTNSDTKSKPLDPSKLIVMTHQPKKISETWGQKVEWEPLGSSY